MDGTYSFEWKHHFWNFHPVGYPFLQSARFGINFNLVCGAIQQRKFTYEYELS